MKRTLSTLEALEPRIAPANVTAALTNGLLVVQPTDATESMVASVVQVSADSFSVFDDGVLVDTFTEVETVRVLGGAAKDTITFDALDAVADRFQGDVSLFGRAGREDVVNVLAGWIAGDLRIRAGNEAHVSVADGAVVGGTLRVTGTGLETNAQFDGSFGEVVTSGLREVYFTGAEVAGSVRVSGGGDFADMWLQAGTEVAGGVSYRAAGNPNASFRMSDSAVNGPVDLRFGAGSNPIDLTNSSLGSTLTTHGGQAQDFYTFSDTTVQGQVRFNFGGGDNRVMINAASHFAGGLTLISDATAQETQLTVTDSTIAGRLVMLAAGGDSRIDLVDSSAVLGGMLYDGADGRTIFNSNFGSTVAGWLDYRGGTGANYFNVEDARALRGIRFDGGAGVDRLLLPGTGGDFLIIEADLGSGNDSANFAGAAFSRITLDGGAGRDSLFGEDALTGPRVSLRSFEVRD